MKRSDSFSTVGYCLLAIGCGLLMPLCLHAQSDTTLTRSVTVERDFQPVIQAAGKVSTKPSVIETQIESAPVEYSDYTADVTPEASIHPLLSQPTRFAPSPDYKGYVRGALGHPNTQFDFGYHLDDGKKSILDVYAHHKAQWGTATLSRTTVGLDFTHPFSTCSLYFGVNGGNVYYYKYGHWYDYTQSWGDWAKNREAYPRPYSVTDKDKTSLWTAEAFVGVKANAKQDFQYKIQTGYKLFAKPNAVAEHQIRTHASFDWHTDAHHVGAVLYVQNNFLHLSGALATTIPDSLYNSRHNIRIEPYYAYNGNRVQMHVGVNLDLNIGRGQNSLSGVENLSFAPSPHVHLEAQIAKSWLTLYADAKGSHGLGTLQAYMEANRYRLIHPGVISHHVAPYAPVDAEVGFYIKPYRDLLIEIHGGYALQLNNMTFIATADSAVYKTLGVPMQAGDISYTYSDYGRGKVGAKVNYHYRDYVSIHLHGDYYFWSALRNESNGYTYYGANTALTDLLTNNSTTVYDRARWDIGLRIDGRIDKHWTLYSNNYFEGSRLALATDGEHRLSPTVDLNLGVQYDMWVGKTKSKKPNLSVFCQLNNWLHRKHELYYGYRTQGLNCLVGATYHF